MTKHATTVANYSKDLRHLANEIGDLRYDALAEFLKHLSEKLQLDSVKDETRGRTNLAAYTNQAGKFVFSAYMQVVGAWDICEPYMEDSNG